MTNVQNKQENVSTQSFVQIPHSLMKAKHYLSRITGNPVKLSASDKWVYAQMQDRWKFFTGHGKGYWDTQQQVADAVGMERKTVMVIIQNFVDHGIFEVTKKARNNIYTVIHDLELCSVPTAPQKASKIVESKALGERYSEPEEVVGEVIAEVIEEEKLMEEKVIQENDWEEESEVVFVDETVSVVRMEKYNNKYTYGQDYFPDYPKSPYDQHGKVSDEFKAWLMKLGGELTCDTYFEFEGDFYRIPRCSL